MREHIPDVVEKKKVEKLWISLDLNLGCHSSAHNIFLHTLATRGIIGFLAFVFLWYSILKSLFKRIHFPKDNLSYALNVGVFVAFCALLFAGLFETNFNDSEVIMMSWLLLGISKVSNT